MRYENLRRRVYEYPYITFDGRRTIRSDPLLCVKYHDAAVKCNVTQCSLLSCMMTFTACNDSRLMVKHVHLLIEYYQ